jgi:di- and tripeptidase
VHTCRSACTSLTRSADSTVVSGSVRARVSIRIVLDREVDAVAATLQPHLEATVRGMGLPNRLVVNVDGKADWWLGSLDDPWFKLLEAAVGRGAYGHPRRRGTPPYMTHWLTLVQPIPSILILGKEFGCPAHYLFWGRVPCVFGLG